MLSLKVQWRRQGAEVVLMIRSRYQFSRAGRVTLRRDETLPLSVMVMMMIFIQTVTKSHHIVVLDKMWSKV